MGSCLELILFSPFTSVSSIFLIFTTTYEVISTSGVGDLRFSVTSSAVPATMMNNSLEKQREKSIWFIVAFIGYVRRNVVPVCINCFGALTIL